MAKGTYSVPLGIFGDSAGEPGWWRCARPCCRPSGITPSDSNGEAPSLSQATFWVPSLLVLPAFLLPPHHHQNWRGKDQRRSVLVAPNSLPVLGLPRIWRAGRRGRRSHELLLPPSPRTHTCCCFSPANCQFSATFLFPAPERK